MTEQKSSEGIYTYCIEYAKTQQSKCDSCKKIIPNKSLRAAEIYRKSSKEKKNLARHTWYHFKCWKGKKQKIEMAHIVVAYDFFYSPYFVNTNPY